MFRKFLTWFLSITVIILVLIGLIAFYWEYSDGFRVGQVIKLSRKGFLIKTWEGQLDQGFLAPADDLGASSSVATRIWNFSVHGKDEHIHLIDDALTRHNLGRAHQGQQWACGLSSAFNDNELILIAGVIHFNFEQKSI